MAMAMYPDIQAKAQAELDAVIGTRLPEMTDRESLPYILRIVKEVFRWRMVLPLGISSCPREASCTDLVDQHFPMPVLKMILIGVTISQRARLCEQTPDLELYTIGLITKTKNSILIALETHGNAISNYSLL
jgi:hypothetical protein